MYLLNWIHKEYWWVFFTYDNNKGKMSPFSTCLQPLETGPIVWYGPAVRPDTWPKTRTWGWSRAKTKSNYFVLKRDTLNSRFKEVSFSKDDPSKRTLT